MRNGITSTRDRRERGRDSRHGIARAALLLAIAALGASPAQARVTRIVIDEVTPLIGEQRGYERLRGRAFGELDPADPLAGLPGNPQSAWKRELLGALAERALAAVA